MNRKLFCLSFYLTSIILIGILIKINFIKLSSIETIRNKNNYTNLQKLFFNSFKVIPYKLRNFIICFSYTQILIKTKNFRFKSG